LQQQDSVVKQYLLITIIICLSLWLGYLNISSCYVCRWRNVKISPYYCVSLFWREFFNV